MSERNIVVVLPSLEADLLERLRAAAEAHGFGFSFYTEEGEALPALAEAEILLGQSPVLTKNAPRLKWVCTPSAGVNQFTEPAVFASPQVMLTNSSGAYGVTIAEHTVMVALEILRRQQEYHQTVLQRQWQRDLPVRSLRDARITLLGTGDIGRETALRLRGFAPACLIGVNRSGICPGPMFDRVEPVTALPSLLPGTDLLLVSLPGTRETQGLLSAEMLSLLPDGAVIVNVGRGSVICQDALEAELRSGRLWAALDVFVREPIPPEDSLWSCPHLLITPHVAGNMTLPYTRKRIVELFLEDLDRYCAGAPLARLVDLKKGY